MQEAQNTLLKRLLKKKKKNININKSASRFFFFGKTQNGKISLG